MEAVLSSIKKILKCSSEGAESYIPFPWYKKKQVKQVLQPSPVQWGHIHLQTALPLSQFSNTILNQSLPFSKTLTNPV